MNRIAAITGALSLQVTTTANATTLSPYKNVVGTPSMQMTTDAAATRVAAVTGALSMQVGATATMNRIAAISGALSMQTHLTGTAERAGAATARDVSGALSMQMHSSATNGKGLRTITIGTPAIANAPDTQTPGIPGSADANSTLLALISCRAGSLSCMEDGAGTWNEFIDTNYANGSFAAYWALGTEANDPVLNPSGAGNTTISVVIRVVGANTADPIGAIGNYFSATSADGTVGPIADPTPLQSSNGGVFCFAEQRCRGYRSVDLVQFYRLMGRDGSRVHAYRERR